MERIPVYVCADDPISRAGVAGELRPRPEVLMLTDAEMDQAKVAMVVAGGVGDETLRDLRAIGRSSGARLVLVTTEIGEFDLASVVEAGVIGVVWRTEATPERLVAVIQSAAAGEGAVPPDLLGRLLSQVGRAQRQVLGPRGLNFTDLTEREAEVLRLVSEGFSTDEIAVKVAYSPRTVKQVLHDIQMRFHLRNRCHAVAYAVRNGLI